jgi:threonylcarbamoyladenosine tRNA methylthiotransferase MtaB
VKVCFETFGCRLNKAEALQMEAEYVAQGWTPTSSHSEADLIVVRGCSVTQRAQRDCEKFIAQLKQRHPLTAIRVCGCLNAANRSTAGLEKRPSFNPPSDPDAVPVRTARAYLKVQDGCSGKCSFCIVPKFRGPSVSTPFSEPLSKAARFIEAGYREIVITGCNLSLYASEGKRLPDLIAALASLTGADSDIRTRFRLGSVEPGACAIECVSAMSENENICRFLHIPVQSGSNRILSLMNRPYLAKDVDALVGAARKLMPSIGLGCDLMTGFPGELDIDFMATKSLLLRLKIPSAHVFPYSERPGTPAATYNGRIENDVRSERARELTELAAANKYSYARGFSGKTVEIVSERAGECRGRNFYTTKPHEFISANGTIA